MLLFAYMYFYKHDIEPVNLSPAISGAWTHLYKIEAISALSIYKVLWFFIFIPPITIFLRFWLPVLDLNQRPPD